MTAEFSAKQVRHMFFDREGQACFYCRRQLSFILRGSPLDGGWSVHHRKGRYKGGDTFENGVVLCGNGGPGSGCHGKATTNPDWAYATGLSILRNATTPEFMPENARIKDVHGLVFLLTRDGRAIEVDEGNAA